MWQYSDKVKQHFFEPKNAGAVSGANAVGDVGSLSCGDALRLTLKVDPESERIEAAGFQTFGCGSAIASSSALTELIKGLTLDEALKVDNQKIADYLDGLPPEKMHCSVMGQEALQAAVANYRGEQLVDDHDEGALVCKCFAVDDLKIRATIRQNNLSTVADVTNFTKAGGACSCCHEVLENILEDELSARGELFQPAPILKNSKVATEIVTETATEKSIDLSIGQATLAVADKKQDTVFAASSVGNKRLTSIQRMKLIEKTIEDFRPTLQRDHGDLELVEIDGKSIYVNLIGACTSCQLADTTLDALQQALIKVLGELVEISVLSQQQLASLSEV
ncbi:Fe-S cluster assembly protein NifU [Agaribacterium haliotis]|uniref:Fe-S cluster assembly protein NifU n=1 Tax=Agaribacterium haliotis TaxID=2013869 RepID=UPI000BB5557B|nr:Fe-S cluster assembly protein NifU [Agaribacterium haliotis]